MVCATEFPVFTLKQTLCVIVELESLLVQLFLPFLDLLSSNLLQWIYNFVQTMAENLKPIVHDENKK